MNPNARTAPSALIATSTGVSKRRFSPTNALSRPFVDE